MLEEKKIIKKYLKHGYVIIDLENKEIKKLNNVKKKIFSICKKKIKKLKKYDKNFFEKFHEVVNNKELNNIRLKVFNELNKKKFNLHFYNLFRNYIELITGNETVIQKKINVSIQMPNDESSLLPVHSDTWAGDSPYEIVIWTPLVDVEKTQSMFLLPKNAKIYKNFNKIKFFKNDQVMKKIKKNVKFLNIKFGQVLIFNQNLPHGNVVNKEKTTRWSFNARVKSLMSPYSKKGLLDFFDIVKIFPATEQGLNYEYPKFK